MRDALIESRLTPNAISLTGFALCLVAAGLIFADMIVLGGIAYIIGSICDTLDGRYSRMSGKGSPFGAFLDSTLDRVEEGVVLAAVAYHFAEQGNGVEAAICAIAILASVMVSYTRARAEALGVDCKVGIGSRATRVVILSVGLLFANGLGLGDFSLLAPAVILLAAIGIVTTLQRIFHVRGKLISAAAPPEAQTDL
jgi:CDP-diacylglycerol--glycerol-3-phosphate 3-phosphatidyltransferase